MDEIIGPPTPKDEVLCDPVNDKTGSQVSQCEVAVCHTLDSSDLTAEMASVARSEGPPDKGGCLD